MTELNAFVLRPRCLQKCSYFQKHALKISNACNNAVILSQSAEISLFEHKRMQALQAFKRIERYVDGKDVLLQ